MTNARNLFIALLLIDLVALGGLWYGHTVVHDKKDEGKALQAELANEINRVERRSTLRKLLRLAEKEHVRLEPYLYGSDEEDQIRFISDIERLGRETTGAFVDVRSFDFRSDPKSFHGEFAISGSWPQLYRLLRLLEEFPGRLAVRRYDVHTATARGVWEGTVSLDLLSIKVSP